MQKILVFGSAHIDVFVQVDVGQENDVNKTGTMDVGLGGVGYNVAVNLARNGDDVSLYTFLKRDSIFGRAILESLIETGVKTEYVFTKDFDNEPGYVAHVKNGQLISGITSTAIDSAFISPAITEKAIEACGIVAIDCNLSKDQIAQIVGLARNASKPVFLCSAGENKVYRAVLDEKVDYRLKAMFINDKEATKANPADWKLAKSESQVVKICDYYNSENVIITNGKHGYSIFSIDGIRRDFAAGTDITMVSEIGAGDALAAAFISSYSKSGAWNWNECRNLANSFLKPVLSSRFTTPEVAAYRS